MYGFNILLEEVPVTFEGKNYLATTNFNISYEVGEPDRSVGIFDHYCEDWCLEDEYASVELMDEDGEVVVQEVKTDHDLVQQMLNAEKDYIAQKAMEDYGN